MIMGTPRVVTAGVLPTTGHGVVFTIVDAPALRWSNVKNHRWILSGA
ncbi:hypothetical protein LCGC14_0294510 [marine sediment metagenome]|uniref:Uncharacterized protein n=1 Tax=marine sediment metagenome TaxID=412755 RepID=A0A0F9WXS4_9ZZZZ